MAGWKIRVKRLALTTVGEAAVLCLGAVWAYRRGERLYLPLVEQCGAMVPVLDHLEPEPTEEVRLRRIPSKNNLEKG